MTEQIEERSSPRYIATIMKVPCSCYEDFSFSAIFKRIREDHDLRIWSSIFDLTVLLLFSVCLPACLESRLETVEYLAIPKVDHLICSSLYDKIIFNSNNEMNYEMKQINNCQEKKVLKPWTFSCIEHCTYNHASKKQKIKLKNFNF